MVSASTEPSKTMTTGRDIQSDKIKRLPPSLNLAKAKQATVYANAIQFHDGAEEDESGGTSGEEQGVDSEAQENPLRSDAYGIGSFESFRSDSSDSSIDLEKDLARLDKLRKNVKQNLKLRPINSASTLRNSSRSQESGVQSPISPSSTTSAYFTPLDEQPSGGNPVISKSERVSLSELTSSLLAAPSPPVVSTFHPNSFNPPRMPFTPRSPFTPGTAELSTTPHTPYTPPIYTSMMHTPQAISAGELYSVLFASSVFNPESRSPNSLPLVIDTRPLASHTSFHIRHSIPIAIPSLILKRSRKPGLGPGGKGSQFTSIHSLRQFVTTDHGKKVFDTLLRADDQQSTCEGNEERLWNGDVVVYDEDMDEKDRTNPSSTPWSLIGVIQSLLDAAASARPSIPPAPLAIQEDLSSAPEEVRTGKADYLKGGIGLAGHDPDLQTLIVGNGEDGDFPATSSSPNDILSRSAEIPYPSTSFKPVPIAAPKRRKGPPPSLGLGGAGGLFQLDTHQASYKTRGEVQIDQSLNSASTLASATPSAVLDSVQSDRTARPLHLTEPPQSTPLSALSDSNSYVLSSVPTETETISPSPLPMMPAFSASSLARPYVSPLSNAHPFPSTHPSMDNDPPAVNFGLISGSAFKTPFTSLADPTPSPPPSKIQFSLGGGTAYSANVASFKRPPPPGQVNKRPSAPNLRIGTSAAPTLIPSASQPVAAGKRLPKLSLNTGGVGGLGVGGEKGTGFGGGAGGSLGRRAGTKLRSATVGGGPGAGGHWGDRESQFYSSNIRPRFGPSRFTVEPEALALSPTSNSMNIFQSLTLPLPSSINGNPAATLHPPSPSHLHLTHSNHRVTPSPPGSARLYGSFTGDIRPPSSPGFGKTSFSSPGYPLGGGRKIIGLKHSPDEKHSSQEPQTVTAQALDKQQPENPEPLSPSSSDRSSRSSTASENESQKSLTSLTSYPSTDSSLSMNSETLNEPLSSFERHGRSDSVSSVNSNSSGGPKTAYFTPPHTPTQMEPSSFALSAHPSRALKSHSNFFGYSDETGPGGVHGTGHPPNLYLSQSEDEYEHPATPRTARPEDESGSGVGFPKAPDGSGPLLPPQLSTIAFYGQDHDEDEGNFSQRYSYSAYPAAHEDASFGGSFGYPPYGPHPYGDRERSSSFSSLYPPPSTDSVDSEGEGEDPMSFTVSTILPGFLFLGPEPTSWDHVKQLKNLGVKRIINLAAECGPDDWGLALDKPGEREKEGNQSAKDSMSPKQSGFEKYFKVAMRDTVEEDGIGRGVRMVCEMLDHARLLSAPVYVHCKAGKSRSVTAVIAYLIHANHWPLSKAYSFVLERRKGISPNIGFVSELMGFEEEELGGKSGGVSGAAWGAGKGYVKHHHWQGGGGAGALPQPSAPAATQEAYGGDMTGGSTGNQHGYSMIASMRKSGHTRESMPPPATHAHHGYSYSVNETTTSSRLLSDENGSGSGSSSGSNSASSSTTTSPDINGEYRAGALYENSLGGSGSEQNPSFPPLSAGGILALGDAAQELEVRDSSGRYRHARRAPVNEATLQPMRRVSKAGLESGEFYRGEGKITWGEDDEAVVEDIPQNEKEV